jgi:dipeptidyl aminopeptidase/acylaminoacyl peptidase
MAGAMPDPAATQGGPNLTWSGAGGLIFVARLLGLPQLYRVGIGGHDTPILLGPKNSAAEFIAFSRDARRAVVSSNSGTSALDTDRRHLFDIDIASGSVRLLTSGRGIEVSPVILPSGQVACLSGDWHKPLAPALVSIGQIRSLCPDSPSIPCVEPKQVVVASFDGTPIHCQFFPPAGPAPHPAVVYVHGGPPRQMLLGWHYIGYYARSYALNQFLASKGFAVLSVNFRLGIGYGDKFQFPPTGGGTGTSELRDVEAATEWLAKNPLVGRQCIGIYGSSYGGFIVDMELARRPDLFAAGVSISGVHDWLHMYHLESQIQKALTPDDNGDLARWIPILWKNSPVANVKNWPRPILVVHTDADRNVEFRQSIEFVNRLRRESAPYEELVIPDDAHDIYLFRNARRIAEATYSFLSRKMPAIRRRGG